MGMGVGTVLRRLRAKPVDKATGVSVDKMAGACVGSSEDTGVVLVFTWLIDEPGKAVGTGVGCENTMWAGDSCAPLSKREPGEMALKDPDCMEKAPALPSCASSISSWH